MTARAEFLALFRPALEAAAEGVTLLDYARLIDPPDRATIMVRFDGLDPSKAATDLVDHKFALIVLSQYGAEGPADDELEDLTVTVVDLVEQLPAAVTWQRAERATFADSKIPAVEVGITVTARKVRTP